MSNSICIVMDEGDFDLRKKELTLDPVNICINDLRFEAFCEGWEIRQDETLENKVQIKLKQRAIDYSVDLFDK